MNAYRRFLFIFLIAVTGCLLILAAFSIAVDPYGVFGTPPVAGLTTAKTLPDHITKPYVVLRGNYDTLIVGSSRARDISCQDLAACYPGQKVRCYNAGVAHADFPMIRRMVDHADTVTPLVRLVIALDFFGFNASDSRFDKTDSERFLGRPGRPPGDILNDIGRMLFSHAALGKAVETLERSRPRPVAPAAEIPPARAAAAADAGAAAPQPAPPPAGHNPFVGFYPAVLHFYRDYTFTNPRTGVSTLDALRSLLASCRRRGIETSVAFNPFHAVLFDILREAGLWKRYLAWKAAVVGIVAAVNADGSGPRIALWDFSDYNRITTEPVLVEGALRDKLEYFSDPFHYKRNVGNLMLRRMIAGEETVPGFGHALVPADVAADAARLEAGHEAFLRDNAAYVDKVLGRAAQGGKP